MNSKFFYFHIPEIPDYTHYKYVTSYEGSVREHIFLRAEHLLRMVANFHSGEVTLALRYFYEPRFSAKPQGRIRLSLCVRTAPKISRVMVDQIICHGPMAEFYKFEEDANPFKNWEPFSATTEVIRLEEGLKPSSPPGLDIHKLNRHIPKIYYCIHPFKTRSDNDFLMLDKAFSSLDEPALLEILVQPLSQFDELDLQYREIVKLMAVNSYSSHDYIVHLEQFDPLGDLYEPKTPGEREIKAKDPIADDFLRIHREFHRILRHPQLQFNVKTWASNQETAHILASAAAESAFEEGTYKLLDYEKGAEWFEPSLKASRDLVPFIESCDRNIWNFFDTRDLFRLAHMTSVDEFKGMFRFPVAGYSTPCCLWKSTDYHRKMDTKDGLLIGHVLRAINESKSKEVNLELINHYLNVSSHLDVPVTMPINLLTKHMFVTGVPGSGKTTAIFNLIVQLFKCGVPFLVIEPGKAEYRQLKTLKDHHDPLIREFANELRIYTPGKDQVSPFRFNPFEYTEGTTTDEHIGQILTCFEASIPLGGPLQALLAESLEAVYRDKERQSKSQKQQAIFPMMADLVKSAKRIMEKKEYSGEVLSNLSAAIDVRLSSLTRLSIGNIFQCRESLPSINELLNHPTIVEIQNLNPYQACLLTLFLLTAIWEEIRINRRQSRELKHVTVIEEAHNIVGRNVQAQPSEYFADPKAYAAEYVVRMLAEIRALGEGIVIADQLPSAVASSVVKNTGTKLAHRLVSLFDREDIGGAMLLQGQQLEEIARLEPGQAYYFTEGLYSPLHITGLNAYGFLGLGQREAADNLELLSVIEKEDWFVELKKERYAYIIQLFTENCRKLEQSINQATGHLEIYDESYKRMNEAAVKSKIDDLMSLRSDIINSRDDLKKSYKLFIDFIKSIPADITVFLSESNIEKYKKLISSSIRKLTGRASDLNINLENLRIKISNTFNKEGHIWD